LRNCKIIKKYIFLFLSVNKFTYILDSVLFKAEDSVYGRVHGVYKSMNIIDTF
jgi:hypothetical protein